MKLKHLVFFLLLFVASCHANNAANKRDLKLDTLSSLSQLNQRYLANLTRSDYSSLNEDEEDYVDENEEATTTTSTTTTTTASSVEEHTDNLDESNKDETLYDDNETTNNNNNNNNEYEDDETENTEDEEDTTSQADPYNCPSQCKCKFNKLEHKTESKTDETLDDNEYEEDTNEETSKRQVINEYEQDLANEKYRIEVDCSASNINTIRNLFDEEFPLDQIVKFNLSSNKFRVLKLDEGFEDLTSLEELDLSRNALLKSLSARNFLKKFRHLKHLKLESLPQINCDSSDYLAIDCKWFKTLIYLHKRNISVALTKCELNQLSAQSSSIVSRCFGGGGGVANNQKKSSNLFQIDSVLFELKLEPELDQILIDGDTLELACRLRKQSKGSTRKTTDLTNRIFLESHLKWFMITSDLVLSELKPSQFNIFETNHRVKNDLIIDSKLLVKNVKSTHNSGKYFCTTSNLVNSKLNGLNTSNVEITILNKNNEYLSIDSTSQQAKTKLYCGDMVTTTYKGKYKWTKTLANTKSKQKCLFNNRDAYFACDSQGHWSVVPNLDECSFESNLTRYLQHLTKLDAKSSLKLASNISLDDLIHKLVAFQSGDINPYDILYIQRFLIANQNKSRVQQRQLIWLNDLISKLTVLKQAKQFDQTTFGNYFRLSLIPNLVSKLSNETSLASLNGSDLVLASNYLTSVLITSSMLNKSRTNENLVCYLDKYSLTQQIYFRCYLTDQLGAKPYTTRVELALNKSNNSLMFLLFENANMFPREMNSSGNYTDLSKQNRLIAFDLDESEENNQTCAQIFAFISAQPLNMSRLNVSLEIKMPSKYYRLLSKIESKLASKQLELLKANLTARTNVKLFELDKNPFDQIFSQLEYQVVNSISNQNLTQDDLDDLELNDTLKLKQFKLSLSNKWLNIYNYNLVYFNSTNQTMCTILSLEQHFNTTPKRENTYKLYAKLACRLDTQANTIQYVSLRNEHKFQMNHSFNSDLIEMIDQYMKVYNLNDLSLIKSIYSMLTSDYRWFSHKIVYFSSVVSILMMLITLVTYLISRKTLLMPRSFYHVLVNIWLTVSLLIFTFILSVNQINIAHLCLPASISLHYLTLCASCWYTLYFYSLFSKLNTLKKRNYNLIFNLTSDKKDMVYKALNKTKQVSKSDDDDEDEDDEEEEEFIQKPVVHLYMLGYGLPLLLCSIIVSITKRDYLSVPFNACFTNETNILIGSVIVPLVIMFLVKLCFICLVLFTLKRIINDLKKDSDLSETKLNENNQGEQQVSKFQMCQKWTENNATTNEDADDQKGIDQLNESKGRVSLAVGSNIYSERTSVMDTQHKPNIQVKFAFISLVVYLIGWALGALLAMTPALTKKYCNSNSWDNFTPKELLMNDLLRKIFSYLIACTMIVYSMMQISFYLLSRDDVYVYKPRATSSYFNRKRIRFSLIQMCFNRTDGKLRQISESSEEACSSSSDNKQNDVVTIENDRINEEQQNWYYETNQAQQQVTDSPHRVDITDTEHRQSICDVLFSARKQSPSTVSLKSESSQEQHEQHKSIDLLNTNHTMTSMMPTLASQEETGDLDENPYSKLHAHKKPSHVRNPSLLNGSITQNIQILNGTHYLQDTSMNKSNTSATSRTTKMYKKPPYVFVDYKYEEKILKSTVQQTQNSKLNDLLLNSCSVNTGTAIDSIPDMIDSGIKSIISETTQTLSSCLLLKNKIAHSNGSESATPSLSVSSSNTVSSLNFINNIGADMIMPSSTVTHVTSNETNIYSNRSSQLSTLMIYQSLKKQQQQQSLKKLELNHETSV